MPTIYYSEFHHIASIYQKNQMGSKILVTGGLGYIGSHTTIELANAGFQPVIVDNLSNSRHEVIKRIANIIGYEPMLYIVDLCDMEAVKMLAEKESNIKGIIHFAACKSVGESVQLPLMYYRNNLVSLINILEAYKSKVINLIFSSSCTVYGQPDQLPVTEQTPLKNAQCPYGRTKQMAEKILEDITISNQNLRVLSLRYFNPVGAHASGLIGELPSGVAHNLVPIIIKTAMNREHRFTVFGNDYNTKDGTNVRDYVHVMDIAKAHVCALQKLCNNEQPPRYDVYNLGTGRGYSVLEVIKTFEKVSGITVNYGIGERRSGDVDEIWADVRKAENQLKWKAELDLEVMLMSAWNWGRNVKENPFWFT
jgi:UDP-glucose 4-epimerase